jgi:hypothetical protein
MQIHPNVIIYTFNDSSIFNNIRNSGPYYEPGMFSIFLNISLLFNMINNKNITNKNIINIIFIIAIITTFSTAGYLGLFLIIIGSHFKFNSIKSVILLLSFILISVYIYNTLPFMKEKVEKNIMTTDKTTSRFGSLTADIIFIAKNPIIGNGRFLFERMNVSIWDIETRHRNNGISKLMVNYGILFAVYFFILVFKSFKKIINFNNSQFSPIVALILILSLGFSQVLFQYSFFLCLPFLPYAYKSKNEMLVKY